MESDNIKLSQSVGINSKKKPPRLKSTDRTISVAIENYTPQKPSSLSSLGSSLLIDKPIIIDETGILTKKLNPNQLLRRQQSLLPLPPSVITQSSSSQSLSSSNKKQNLISDSYDRDSNSKIFYMDESLCPHLRKTSFRRSDTLNVTNPSGYLLRKTHSFHQTNDDDIEQHTLENENDIIDFNNHLLVSRSTGNSGLQLNTNMGRGNYVFPQKQLSVAPPPQLTSPSSSQLGKSQHDIFIENSNRRNCRMHRSFVEQNNRNRLGNKPSSSSSIFNKKDAIKCRSFNDEIYIDPSSLLQRSQNAHKKFNSANVSIENDLYRSRSNSRNRNINSMNSFDDNNEIYIDFLNSSSNNALNNKKYLHRQNTIENVIEHKNLSNFKRNTRNTTSFYLNPNHADDLQHIINKTTTPSSSSSRLFDTAQNIRRLHSASLKFRNNKENLMIQTKKSKSFITDIGYPTNSFDSANTTLTSSITSFHRKDSNSLFPSDDGFHSIKKSPIRHVDNILIDHHKRLSYDRDDVMIEKSIERSPKILPPSLISQTSIDPHSEYTQMARSFRHQSLKLPTHYRKPSITTNPRRKSTKKKKSSLPTSTSNNLIVGDNILNDLDNNLINNNNNTNPLKINKIIDTDNDDDDDNNLENKRKRKKIVCIIMTVFLSLVFASVFVVVITLTHSGVAQVQNQTRKYYTFSRDSPIHYNGII